jgi:hypothetical protein
MKWAFSIRQKIKAAAILGGVFLLILTKNWFDERKVSELGNSFSEVYEDRLLAESYIYKLSDQLYQKKIMLENCSSQKDNSNLIVNINKHNSAINNIILHYSQTKLTEQEGIFFREFELNVAAIEALENQFLSARELNTDVKNSIDERYKVAAKNLHQLSGIQVAEGKTLNERSKSLVAGSTILTQFELVILIGIGLLIQVLIFSSRSAIPKKPQHFSLN